MRKIKNKIKSTKEYFIGFLVGGIFVGIFGISLYVKPRAKAYANALRVAHEDYRELEGFHVDKIQKEGAFTVSIKK